MSGQSDWTYQSISEVELRQKGRETLQQSKAILNPNNMKMIEKVIYDLSVDSSTSSFNRKKYACLIQEFLRDVWFLKRKTVNEVYQIYLQTLRDPSHSQIGWNSSLFDDIRAKEQLEIENISKPVIEGEKGFYECPRCHQKNTNFTVSQRRSADEESTVTVFCLNPLCGYRYNL
jgi:DNA-directed RNA polymerase subunit M/transcription elongation factor TFIIS